MACWPVTFGSNIPLFTFAYDPVVAIPLPGQGLLPEVEVKVGALFTPLPHSAYWTDNDFTKPVARFLADLL